MDFFKKIGNIFPSSPTPTVSFYPLSVRCNRCGEVLEARVHLSNELSVEYDEKGNITGYVCRKMLQGSGMCFQTIEVNLHFNPNRILTTCDVTGGKVVDE